MHENWTLLMRIPKSICAIAGTFLKYNSRVGLPCVLGFLFMRSFAMELLWLYYKGLKNSRYILFLKLGTRDGKLCGLDTKKISDGERSKIIHGISGISLDAAIRWLRTNCPLVLRTAYRELTQERAQIKSTYPIDPSKINT
jgi:hypothetical protein